MIDLFIEQSAAQFVKSHNEYFRDGTPCRLDYTWDSLHVIDSVLQESLTAKQGSEVLAEKILGLSCYVGIVTYNIWKLICKDSKISFTYSQQNGSCVILKMEKGLYVAEDSISVDFFDVVLKTMQMPLNAINYAKGNNVAVGLEQFRFSYVIQGIIMGVSPFIKGVWQKIEEADLSLYLHELTNFLALNKLTSLKLKHPTKDNIIVESIFNPHLILPPLGYKDPYIGSRPIFDLIQSIKNLNLQKSDILELGLILIESSAILEASMGYVLLGAFNDQDNYSDILSEFAIHYPILAGQLKAPYELFCKEILNEKIWPELSKEKEISASNHRIKKEAHMGLNPLFFMNDVNVIHDPVFRPYFEYIDTYLIKEAFSLGNKLIGLDDCPHSIKLQHAWLALECNAPHVSNDIINNIKINMLDLTERLRAFFIQVIVNPQYIDSNLELVTQVLKTKEISQIHKKQFALICAGYINHTIEKDSLLKLLTEEESVVSFPLLQILQKNNQKVEAPKKIRKAYWSKYSYRKLEFNF